MVHNVLFLTHNLLLLHVFTLEFLHVYLNYMACNLSSYTTFNLFRNQDDN